MKKFKYKLLVVLMLVMTLSYTPTIFLAQTLDQLENEIEKIKEESANQLEEQEQIKAEKADTEAEIIDVKAEIDTINANIATAQAEIDAKNAEIATQEDKIAEIQAQIPEAKEEAGQMLLTLQKIENSNVMVQMVLSPSDSEEDNILRRMESMNSLSEYAGSVVIELVDIERELQYEKTVLDKQKAELEQNEIGLQTEQKNLTAKEEEFKQVLAQQSDAIGELDSSVEQAAEDQKMMEDTLAYYQSLGCSGEDVVGSKCGLLADDDGDGISNGEDSCPNESGTGSDGCPVVETTDEATTSTSDNSSSSGNSSSGGSSSSSFGAPLRTGVVTCEYLCYSGHYATDMDYADYAPVVATNGGVVTTARGGCDPFYSGVNTCNGGYGNYVMVTHYTNDGVYFSLYGHLSSISVSQGQTVSKGTQLGLLGDSGNSNGSHLHFELYKDANGNGIPDDSKTNPRNYVSLPNTGVFW